MCRNPWRCWHWKDKHMACWVLRDSQRLLESPEFEGIVKLDWKYLDVWWRGRNINGFWFQYASMSYIYPMRHAEEGKYDGWGEYAMKMNQCTVLVELVVRRFCLPNLLCRRLVGTHRPHGMYRWWSVMILPMYRTVLSITYYTYIYIYIYDFICISHTHTRL